MSSRRVLLVPSLVHGSVEHYYDFLLGYLFPITLWLARHPGTPVTIRSCAGMDPWFALLPPGTDVEIVPAGGLLRRFVSHREPRVVLRSLDNPRTFRRSELDEFVARIRSVADVPAVGSGRGVVVVERGALSDAASRRSVPNLAEVAAAVATVADGPLTMLGATPVPPRDQIAAHTSAHLLVGQHGAGLVNMLWMPTGSTVVELLPPLNRQVRTIYLELAAVLGHSYLAVPQESVHAPVDAAALVEALRRRPAPVPQTAGVRLRREAFRAGKLTEERLRRAPLVGSALRRLT